MKEDTFMLYYNIYQDGDEQWKWELVYSYMKIAVSPIGYDNKSDCEQIINVIKRTNLTPVLKTKEEALAHESVA